jgi:hypothetical protein
MVMASPSMGADMPYLTPEYETTIENLFIVGELGGLALIKNAINQGRDCIDTITKRIRAKQTAGSGPGVYDVLIVGAGPAGITASLRAIENRLSYITIERRGRGNGGKVSAPEGSDHDAAGVSDVRKTQENRTLQGTPSRLL